jgi:pimeloyl-ACP methyl ester carboxylesterase
MAIHIYPEPSPNSPVMHRCRIHVPDDNEPHPILYLLHGVGDSEDDWDDVSDRKGILSQWLPPAFPMYVVLPYCKPRSFPGGRQFAYPHSFPNADQFVEYFEQGLVANLRNRYPNGDWQRQAIGGISMGGYLAFEIATRRIQTPFRCIGLFSAALQSCANLAGSLRNFSARRQDFFIYGGK